MQVNSVNLLTQNNLNTKSAVLTNRTKYNSLNTTSFGAKKFSSGCYSDWFAALIKEKIKLPESVFNAWREEHLSTFGQKFRHPNGKVHTRANDIDSLAKDIRAGEKPIEVEADFDAPYQTYSSERDYNKQTWLDSLINGGCENYDPMSMENIQYP